MEAHRIPFAPPSIFYIPDFITAEEEKSILKSIPSHKWISLSHRRLQAIPAKLTATNTLISSSSSSCSSTSSSSNSLPEWLSTPIVQRIHDLGVFAEAPHGINHCLINEYLPGQGIMPHEDGAAYHPVVATVSLGGTVVLEMSEKNTTAAHDDDASEVTPPSPPRLSSQTRQPRQPRKPPSSLPSSSHGSPLRILQSPRSLLITTASAYQDMLHGIATTTEDVDLSAATVANWGLLGEEVQRDIEMHGGRRTRATTRVSLTFRDVRKVAKVAMMVGKGPDR